MQNYDLAGVYVLFIIFFVVFLFGGGGVYFCFSVLLFICFGLVWVCGGWPHSNLTLPFLVFVFSCAACATPERSQPRLRASCASSDTIADQAICITEAHAAGLAPSHHYFQ